MSVRTEQGSAADVVNHLHQRECEIAILRPPSPEPELAVEPLFYAQLFVVAGSRSKWTRQRRISFADLPEEPLIQSVGEMEPGSAMLEAFRSAGVEGPRVIVLSSSVNHLSQKGEARETQSRARGSAINIAPPTIAMTPNQLLRVRSSPRNATPDIARSPHTG